MCPQCHASLRTSRRWLTCRGCRRVFPVVEGLPDLVLDELLDDNQAEERLDWDELAPRYSWMADVVGRGRFDLIDRPLIAVARGRVLEVGCGDGRLLAQLRSPPVTASVGIDYANEMLRIARRRGLEVYPAIAERLPFPDSSFDTVLSGFYALRYTRLDEALAEVARVLKPGGRFGLTLLGRRATALGARLSAIPLLVRLETFREGLKLMLAREVATLMPNDVTSAAELRARLTGHGLEASLVLGTPYLPLLSRRLQRWTGGRLPYLRGEWAARFGYDVIVLGRRFW